MSEICFLLSGELLRAVDGDYRPSSQALFEGTSRGGDGVAKEDILIPPMDAVTRLRVRAAC